METRAHNGREEEDKASDVFAISQDFALQPLKLPTFFAIFHSRSFFVCMYVLVHFALSLIGFVERIENGKHVYKRKCAPLKKSEMEVRLMSYFWT